MSSETKAREGIDLLVKERDEYKRRAQNAEGIVARQATTIRELEDRAYGSTARAFDRLFDVEREYLPERMADLITIRPKTANMMLAREKFFSARNPLDVIDNAIKQVVRLHGEHLTEQLREAMWPRR